jgi:hypothetical protein
VKHGGWRGSAQKMNGSKKKSAEKPQKLKKRTN